MDQITKAIELFGQGYMCSQAVFAAFSEQFGITEQQALKIGGCFGGGMNKGEVCGACTGALMVLGMKYGQVDLNDQKSRAQEHAKAEEFLEEFKKCKGSYICRDILGCDISTEEGRAYALDKGLFGKLCPEMVKTAAEIVSEILAENE